MRVVRVVCVVCGVLCVVCCVLCVVCCVVFVPNNGMSETTTTECAMVTKGLHQLIESPRGTSFCLYSASTDFYGTTLPLPSALDCSSSLHGLTGS